MAKETTEKDDIQFILEVSVFDSSWMRAWDFLEKKLGKPSAKCMIMSVQKREDYDVSTPKRR